MDDQRKPSAGKGYWGPQGLAVPDENGLPSLDPRSMASKSFNSAIPQAPSLALPKGDGSIRGMGEKVDVNLTDGSGSAVIPIRLSQARGKIVPDLSLQYRSSAGNGEFGLGWKLSLPQISRKTEKGLPRYGDANSDGGSDVYLLSSAEDLVPVIERDSSGNIVFGQDGAPKFQERTQDGYTVRRYAPRIQKAFDCIERWTSTSDSSDIHWRKLDAENQTILFGTSTMSRIFNPKAEGGVSPETFSWLVSEIYDSRGNSVIFHYKAEDSANVLVTSACEANRNSTLRSANRYLKMIQYGNTVPNRELQSWNPMSGFDLPQDVWRFSAVFDYGEHDVENPKPNDSGTWACRLDPFSDCRAGYDVRTYRLCQRILIFHHFPELGSPDYLVKSTEITYASNNIASRLVGASQSGYSIKADGTGPLKKSLPPVQFEYSLFPADDEVSKLVPHEIDVKDLANVPMGVDGQDYQWVDLDNEGLPGILTEQAGGWFYARNTSASNITGDSEVPQPRFDPLRVLGKRPIASVANSSAHFGDVSGSGKTDVITTTGSSWGYYERTQDDSWTNLQLFRRFPNTDMSQKDVKFVDLTGDGLADILIYADQVYVWYPSLGLLGYGDGVTVTQPNTENYGGLPIYGDSEQSIYLADMSGDGLTDLVRIRNHHICYWPNYGQGKFGPLVRMDSAPVFDHDDLFSHARVRLADIDGSGTTDIIYLGGQAVDVYLNQSGNSFSNRKRLESFPPNDQLTSVSALDILGNGTSCLVWSSPLPGAYPSHLRYIDFTQGKKPYLLTKVVNNLGTETNIHYAPSTRFYLEDMAAGKPWVTHPPFAVHVVERKETVDKISGNKLTSKYRYYHGYFDSVEREFRGFARVDQWDTDDFSALKNTASTDVGASWHVPPVLTKSWFHTGAYIGRNEIGSVLAGEYFKTPSLDTSLDDTVLPPGLNAIEQQEACRALKGLVLRKEVYASDNSSLSQIPFSVQQSNYSLKAIQPEQDSHQHAVYFVCPRESVLYQFERKLEDPRIQHEMILEVDDFGNVLKGLKVAYGRQLGKSPLTRVDKQRQESSLLLYSEAEFTNSINDGINYLLPHPCEVRQYELSGLERQGGSRFKLNDLVANGFAAILQLPEAPFESTSSAQTPQRRLFKRLRLTYRKDDLSGSLPHGQIQPVALTDTAYEMVITPGLLEGVFKLSNPGSPPISLIPDPITTIGGRGESQAAYVDLEGNGSWWKQSAVVRYSSIANPPQSQELSSARSSFFSPRCFIDSFGNTTVVDYDAHVLFPVRVQNAVGNVVTTVMDYRTLEPAILTSANGNRTLATFDALGLVAGFAWKGKATETVGDNLDGFVADLSQNQIDAFFQAPTQQAAADLLANATSRVVYDYQRYFNDPTGKSPVFTAAITRETHNSEPTPPGGLKVQIKFTYSDGFGRGIQTKDFTKPGPLVDNSPTIDNRWVGSGWVIYNNKGQPVRQYENFFDDTNQFKFNMKIGVSSVLMYDLLGRKVAVLRPDHTLETLDIPDAWSRASFDLNDNVLLSDPKLDPKFGAYFQSIPEHEYKPSWYDARIGGQMGREEMNAAIKCAAHASTPLVTHLDPLGRTILDIQDNGSEKFSTHVEFDIQGKVRSVVDSLGRVVLTRDFGMDEELIHESSMDAGERWTLKDNSDDVIMAWNSRGFRLRYVQDPLRRRVQSWMSENGSAEVLIERIAYGEGGPNAANHNLLEEIWKIEDQAGVLVQTDFDFKQNLTRSSRQLWTEYKKVIDLSVSPALENETFVTAVTYDAMSRPVRTTDPDNSIIYRVYNESQHLDKVFVNVKAEQDPNSDPSTWTAILKDVQYNAMYQTTSVSYGNGSTTTRSFDPSVHRLQRVRTVDPSNTTIQDLNYTYDPIGNVASLKDSAQNTVFFRNTKVDPLNEYTYDPIYQLIMASGREHLGQTNGALNAPSPYGPSDADRTGLPSPGDGNALGRYVESYMYDAVGNLLSLKHDGSDSRTSGWTRKYSYNEPSSIEPSKYGNKLSSTAVGSTTERYRYDPSAGRTGNMTNMPHLSSMRWNYRDQLQATSTQIVNAGTPETTYYVYDSKGKRVRKVTERQGTGDPTKPPTRLKETIYLKEYEIFRRYGGDGQTVQLERTSLNANSENTVVARIESRTIGDDGSPQRLSRFQLTNMLGSMCVELDQQSRIISYQEYYPFGSTSYEGVAGDFTNAAPKQYQFAGKERDEESGLYYHGARYYASWLGRWVSADPSLDTAPNLYTFTSNNPVRLVDPDGRAPKAPTNSGGGLNTNGPIRLTPTGVIGTFVHILVLAAVAERVMTEFDPTIKPYVEVRTMPGGSNTPGSNEPGEVDLSLLIPDKLHTGEFIADVTDLKPEKVGQSDYTKAQGQVGRYVTKYPKEVDGNTVSGARVGTFFIEAEKKQAKAGKPSLLRDLVFETDDLKLTIHLYIPENRLGAQIPGLMTYEIELQFKKGNMLNKMIQMAEAQQAVTELLSKLVDKVKVKDVSDAVDPNGVRRLSPNEIPEGQPANDNGKEEEVQDEGEVDDQQAARSQDVENHRAFWLTVIIFTAAGAAIILSDGALAPVLVPVLIM